MSMKKTYIIQLMRSNENFWHEHFVGKRFEVREGKQDRFWYLVTPMKVSGCGGVVISKKYCKVIGDHFVKGRSVRCL